MNFAHPLLLLLLPVPVLLVLAALRWRRCAGVRLLTLSRSAVPAARFSSLQILLLGAAAGAAVLALAGPRWGRSSESLVTRSRNLLIAVDVSRSMLAEDVHPNRLERAKADLIDLVDALKGDRAGILAFRGKAQLICPLTTDKAFLRQSIGSLAPESAPPGETDLADAIRKALDLLAEVQSSHHAIVLISDGEDLAGRSQALAEEAGAKSIPIFTVGIGSAAGAPIPDGSGVVMHAGARVTSRLTESTLQTIADHSGGRYIPLSTAGTARTTLGAVYARYLARLADQEAREQIELSFTDRSSLFAAAAALLVLAAALFSQGRISLPRRAALLAALLLPALLPAGEPAREAQRAYRAGDYPAAAEGYARARAGAEPAEAAHYAYNEALARWRAGDVTNALARVRLAVEDPAFTVRASTLEGTLLLQERAGAPDAAARLKLHEAAIAAFTRALQGEATDAARRNLARARQDLDTLRFDARKEAALKQYADQQPNQLADQILRKQRALAPAVAEVFNGPDPHVRLSQAAQLAKDVRAQADRWFPIAEFLPQAVTNETQRAELLTRIAQTQAALDRAAEGYEALEPDLQALHREEPFAYELWKSFADVIALNAESIAVQSNALTRLTRYQPAREDLPEVLALTQHFRYIFPQWAENYLQQQAASTNTVTFTEADRDLIARTADAIVPLLNEPVSQQAKEEVLEKLLLIRDHLPKNPNSQNQQNQQQQQQNQDQNQQQQQNQQQDQQQQQQDQQPQESEADREEEARQEDLEALLRKAADREKEHEEEKRKAARAAVPPGARDW